MVPTHGFFLLPANLTHGKVNFFPSHTMFTSFFFSIMLLNNLALGLQKDTGDARAFSFLQILELMPSLSRPPSMLFVENVVGFEVCLVNSTHCLKFQNIFIDGFLYLFIFFCSSWQQTSDTHAKLIEILKKTNFVTQEFILSPLQFGIPYSRPRYFCLVGFLYPLHIVFI